MLRRLKLDLNDRMLLQATKVINISGNKKPKTIAKEIERRLLCDVRSIMAFYNATSY